jgi:hypothetical protein
LILVDWAHNGGHIQVGLGEWKSLLLSPYINFIQATMAALLLSLLSKARVADEKD